MEILKKCSLEITKNKLSLKSFLKNKNFEKAFLIHYCTFKQQNITIIYNSNRKQFNNSKLIYIFLK